MHKLGTPWVNKLFYIYFKVKQKDEIEKKIIIEIEINHMQCHHNFS